MSGSQSTMRAHTFNCERGKMKPSEIWASALRNVENGRRIVADQKARIDRSRLDGRDPIESRKLLGALERSLKTYEDVLREVEERVQAAKRIIRW